MIRRSARDNRWWWTLLVIGSTIAPVAAAAQQPTDSGAAGPAVRREPPRASRWAWLYRIDGDSADRLRMAQLRGASPTAGALLRTTSALTPGPERRGDALAWAPLLPMATVVRNYTMPLSLNDGALWAGAGVNLRLSGGVQAARGRLRVILAPELLYSENRPYALADTGTQRAPLVPAGRSPYASPWHGAPTSIDLPLRLGDGAHVRLHPGQSSLTATLGVVEVGAATENAWWGPGLRSALLLSNNAPGFPHLFVRSARPWRTPAGAVELSYLLGGLSESAYFDTLAANDRRAYTALAVTLAPRGLDGLTVGVARAVYSTVDGWAGVAGRALDVLAHVPEPRYDADSLLGGREQVLSLFSRWVLPASGFEAYTEFARTAFPRSLRDLLVTPAHSRGHTFGFQWLGEPRQDGARLRVQAEFSNVERPTSRYHRPVGSFYTSPRVAQGYTHEGQMLGAATGPGSSTQWLAGDYITPRWSIGLTLQRIRWNDDAHDDRPWAPLLGYLEHDVTRTIGLRGSYDTRFGRVTAHAMMGSRLNTFFDDGRETATDPPSPVPRDEPANTIVVTLTPRW